MLSSAVFLNLGGASELVGWPAAGLAQKFEKCRGPKKAILLLSKYIVLDHFWVWRPGGPFWVPEGWLAGWLAGLFWLAG